MSEASYKILIAVDSAGDAIISVFSDSGGVAPPEIAFRAIQSLIAYIQTTQDVCDNTILDILGDCVRVTRESAKIHLMSPNPNDAGAN